MALIEGTVVSVSLPDRRYELAALLLAGAVNEASRTGAAVAGALTRIATGQGRGLGERARAAAGARPSRRALVDAALAVIEEQGYEPRQDGDEVVLVNCPFQPSSTSIATWCAA